MIYLDNNASTPVAPEVSDAMCSCIRRIYGNPSSSHPLGTEAARTIERARKQTAGLLGAGADEIVFTSGGTEANNIAILGTASRYKKGHIITSSIEHPSVMGPLRYLEGSGYDVTYIPVDRYGLLNHSDIEKNIRKDTILITVMHSNNETGSIQPIAKIGRIANEKGITFHCDAAQSAGKVPVNVKRLGAGMLTIVPHKFHGPKGTGALYIRKGLEVQPVTFGASHERGLRPGTENVAGIAGTGKAAELAKKEIKERADNMKRLSGLLFNELRRHIPGLKLNGHPFKRLPNTLNLSFPGIRGSELLKRLEDDIAASTGSACHEGRHTVSHVLSAMGLPDERSFSAVRLSLGRGNSKTQVNKAVKAIVKACNYRH